MGRRSLAALFLLAACHHDHPTEPPHVVPDAAVAVAAPDAAPARVAETPQPTLRLPTDFTPTAYAAELAVDPAQPTFHGVIDIDATLSEPASIIWLDAVDLTIGSAEAHVGGDTIALTPTMVDGGFLALRPARDLPAGALTVHIEYDGKLRAGDSTGVFVQTEGGDPYVITQFESIYARSAFPCFDEPSSKVPWTLTLDVPKALTALSNSPLHAEDPLPDDQKREHFETTQPLPSYLVAFAIGPFEMVDGGKTRHGAPIRIAAFKGRSADVAHAAATTGSLIAALEDYFGIAYPYAKLDLVPMPSSTWFSAMENAGMITLNERLLLHGKDAGPADLREFDEVTAHELAHQWFGDYVTLSWWDDIWLNEAFADWMEEKVMATRPGWVSGEEGDERADGLGADELVTARKIRQEIVSNDDIETAFDGITYSKGAAVIHMFETWVGADAFRAGVQAYLGSHSYRVADVHDFLTTVDASTPKDLTPAFTTFLDQGGAPMINAKLSCDGGAASVALTQSRWVAAGGTAPDARWQVPVCIASGTSKARFAETCTLLTDASATVKLDGAKGCPTWILPNAHGNGYFHVQLDRPAFEALIKNGWKRLEPGEQDLVAGDALAMIEHGDPLPVADLLDLAPRLAKGDRLQIGLAVHMIDQTGTIVSDGVRPALRKLTQKLFGARARKLGWLPGAKDTLDVAVEREGLTTIDAQVGHDPKLLAGAVKLAATWRDLPESVRAQVLAAAVLADSKVARTLLGQLDQAVDRKTRGQVLSALAATEDPAIAQALFDHMLDPATDLVQDFRVVFELAHHPLENLVEQFIEAHFDEMVPRLPELARARLLRPMTAICDASKRDALATWAKAHIVAQPGGERAMAQSMEQMDQCIARKAALGGAVDEWVKKHGK